MTFSQKLFALAKPIVHKMDAEDAHHFALHALKFGVYPRDIVADDKGLELEAFGMRFPNPLGLAAGFDKNAEAMDGLFAHGFGFVEVGTITPRPQTGNPRPRVFRHAETGSVINAMGFPSKGVQVASANLARFRKQGRHRLGLLGVNIGKNKETADAVVDYEAVLDAVTSFADYITVNISSPNTPGLRDLQKPEFLEPLLKRLLARRARIAQVAGHIRPLPLLVKLSPDNDDVQTREVADVLVKAGVDGVILTNTTLARPSVLPTDFAARVGGLSGRLLAERSRTCLAAFKELVGESLTLVSAGGIDSGAEAQARLEAGAKLVQLYTALVFEGPELVGQIKQVLTNGAKTVTKAA